MELEECMRTVHMADPLSESNLVEKHSIQEARTVAPSVYRPQSRRPSVVTNHTQVIDHEGVRELVVSSGKWKYPILQQHLWLT